jgi:hypothetical protein
LLACGQTDWCTAVTLLVVHGVQIIIIIIVVVVVVVVVVSFLAFINIVMYLRGFRLCVYWPDIISNFTPLNIHNL